jgi:ABC-type branched-subunit amino acid transport system ATPase component
MNNALLKLKKVTKAVNGLRIIDSVLCNFEPGKITGLIGPNGAGKTTLFHLITGELRPDSGEILYGGTKLSGLPPYKVARMGIGRLFQDVRTFRNLTVLENVACSCFTPSQEEPWFPFFQRRQLVAVEKEIRERAIHWLKVVGLQDMTDVRASALSYGQQKLLALARLLAGEFSALLLDEPTAGLSPPMATKILKLLDELVKGDNPKTIILVEHNMNVIKEIADFVLFMNEGKVSFFGRADHVLGDREVMEIYLGF